MMTVGETLRRERLKRNLDLDQVSRELKISPRFLEAIEDENFEKLPGGVFAKAFIRQYGKLLGLNDDELSAQLQQTFDPPPPEPQAPPPSRSFKSGPAPIQVPRMEEWQTVGDRPFRWSGSLSAAIVVVLVMLVCSAVYAWLQRPRPSVTARNNPAPVQTTAPTQPVTAPPATPPQVSGPPSTPQPETQSAAAQPAPTQPVPAQPTPPQQAAAEAPQPPSVAPPAIASPGSEAAPSAPGPVHVEIKADQPVWVLARVDGKFAFSGTLEASQARSVDGTNNVVLRVGNAGGVTLILNGKPVGPIGPAGQVRTIQFTSGGFQIVPAKPPSPPDGPVERL
jgi:cytoskeleton protein RodZ